MTRPSSSATPQRFRKRPVEVEAVRWEGGSYDHLDAFCGRNWARADAVDMAYDDPEQVVLWNTASQQWLHCPVGQWIIRGVNGELYPCEHSIFEATHEPV